MEICVGEYVRTKRGEICKVLGIRQEQRTGKRVYSHLAYYLDNHKGSLTPAFIVKHSPNIKDVLETGDIIEHKIYQEIFKSEIYITNKDEIFTTDGERVLPEEIISVVTNQQFEQIEYKVEE